MHFIHPLHWILHVHDASTYIDTKQYLTQITQFVVDSTTSYKLRQDTLCILLQMNTKAIPVYILICLPYWMLVINSCIPKLSKKQDFLWTSLILIALSAFGKIGVKNITTKTSKHNSFFPDHTSLVLDSEFLQILKTFSILISFDNNKLLPYLDSVIPSTRQEDIVITRSVLHSEHSAHVTIHHQMRWAAIRRYKVITISTNIQLKLPFQNHSIHKKQHGTWVSWVAEKYIHCQEIWSPLIVQKVNHSLPQKKERHLYDSKLFLQSWYTCEYTLITWVPEHIQLVLSSHHRCSALCLNQL